MAKKYDDEFFNSVLQDIYELEGPGAYREDDGTISFRGFNQKTVDAYRKQRGQQPIPVNKLTQDEAISILKDEFYNRSGINKIKNEKVLRAALDFAFNSGPGDAAKMFQATAGVPLDQRDGIIGPKTMEAYKAKVDEIGADEFLNEYLMSREAFLANSEKPGVVNNLDGLFNRVESLRNKLGGNR